MSDPLVSIVIPAFNRAHYIAATLESCLAQTHGNLQVIVVDDGSSDATLVAARTAASGDPRVQIVPAPHAGQNAARNLGLELATGDYVKFLDSDDLLPPYAIAAQVALARSTAAGVVIGGTVPFVNDTLAAVRAAHLAPAPASPPEAFDSLAARFATQAPTFNEILLGRDVLLRTGGFDTRLRNGDEFNLAVRIDAHFPALRVARQAAPVVLLKRIAPDTLSKTMPPRDKLLNALLAQRHAAAALLDFPAGTRPILRREVFKDLYVIATHAWRNGLESEARAALALWRRGGGPRPRLYPGWHDRLHGVLGFTGAERLLSGGRRLARALPFRR